MSIGSPSFKAERLRFQEIPRTFLKNYRALGSDPRAMFCWEVRSSLGSNSLSLFSGRLLSSPLGCPLQIFGTVTDHRNPDSNIALLVFPCFDLSVLSLFSF